MQEWSYLSVVTDGEPLIINGTNVWDYEWKNWDIGTFEVPHPSYPDQRHTMWPYFIEINDKHILFAAGELSNCVWCFYVPK